jgi:hypothetical protein
VDNVHELAGGGVVVVEAGVSGCETGQGMVEGADLLTEEHVDIGWDAAVGMELGKEPLRAAIDVDIEIEPELEAEEGGGIALGEIGVLDAGEEAPFAAAPIEAERALDEEEIAVRCRDADASGAAPVVGLRQVGRGGVVDGIDGGGLGGIGGGGQREIGITTRLTEHVQLIANATMCAGGVGVIEGPVAMNEAEAEGAGGVGGEEAVFREIRFAPCEGGGEVRGGVVLVMEMDLGLAAGGAAEGCDAGKDLLIVLLDGVEEGVAEGLGGGIAERGGQGGERRLPAVYAAERFRAIGVVERLEVIANAEDEMGIAEMRAASAAAQIGGEPKVKGFEHRNFQRCKARGSVVTKRIANARTIPDDHPEGLNRMQFSERPRRPRPTECSGSIFFSHF